MARNPIRISKKGIAVDAGIILYGIVICLASIHESILLWVLSIVGSIAIIALIRLPKESNFSSGKDANPRPAPDTAHNATRLSMSGRWPTPEESALGVEWDASIDEKDTDRFKEWRQRQLESAVKREKVSDF
jgi:hypothetical protein